MNSSATNRPEPSDPTSAEFFDRLYADAVDPWDFASEPYELLRYRSVLDQVDRNLHRRVFEPGCSIGVLTEMLGARCDEVVASDISPIAVSRARERCAHLPGVSIEVGDMCPPPGDDFDLVMLSEVGYYQTAAQLDLVMADVSRRIRPGGRLVAAHWIGHSPDHVLHGDVVHQVIGDIVQDWRHVRHQVHLDRTHDGFRLDVWDRST